jgi:hypothetical protein
LHEARVFSVNVRFLPTDHRSSDSEFQVTPRLAALKSYNAHKYLQVAEIGVLGSVPRLASIRISLPSYFVSSLVKLFLTGNSKMLLHEHPKV